MIYFITIILCIFIHVATYNDHAIITNMSALTPRFYSCAIWPADGSLFPTGSLSANISIDLCAQMSVRMVAHRYRHRLLVNKGVVLGASKCKVSLYRITHFLSRKLDNSRCSRHHQVFVPSHILLKCAVLFLYADNVKLVRSWACS